MVDTESMNIGQLYEAVGNALNHSETPANWDQPLYAGDPEDCQTIDGLTFDGPSNDWHLHTSPLAGEEDQ